MNIAPTKSPRHRNKPPPPPTMVPILYNELIREILSWLSVKDLIRMKCVCKPWNNLITDPDFVKQHLQRSSRNAYLALTWENLRYSPPDLSVIPFSIRRLLENPLITIDDPYYRLEDKNCHALIGSCNGLLCLHGYSSTIEYQENWFYLWNPSTRSISEMLGSFCSTCNILDFAFGYDNSTSTYKVVVYLNGEASEATPRSQVKVFSMGDNSWRNIQSFPGLPIYFSRGVYFKGTLNWMTLHNNSNNYIEWEAIAIEEFVIISLDLVTNTYTELLLPRGFDEVPKDEPIVKVLMDSLCLCHDFKTTHLIIWQMKEFGIEESWTQLLRIPYHNLQIDDMDDIEYYLPMVPLYLSEDGNTLVLANYVEGQAILYNWRENKVERTRITNEEIHWVIAKNYVESLVSPR